jgi:hypothetical protein
MTNAPVINDEMEEITATNWYLLPSVLGQMVCCYAMQNELVKQALVKTSARAEMAQHVAHSRSASGAIGMRRCWT